jgi:hypothetical protein
VQRDPQLLGAGAHGKRDVVPGHTNHTSFTIDKPGTYLGQCAEYCGLSHANMRFRVIAQSPDDFEEWLAGQQDGPAVSPEEAGFPAPGESDTDEDDAGTLFSTTFAVHELPHHRGLEHLDLWAEPDAPRESDRVRQRLVQAQPRQPDRLDPERAGDDPDAVGGLPSATARHLRGDAVVHRRTRPRATR